MRFHSLLLHVVIGSHSLLPLLVSAVDEPQMAADGFHRADRISAVSDEKPMLHALLITQAEDDAGLKSASEENRSLFLGPVDPWQPPALLGPNTWTGIKALPMTDVSINTQAESDIRLVSHDEDVSGSYPRRHHRRSTVEIRFLDFEDDQQPYPIAPVSNDSLGCTGTGTPPVCRSTGRD